MRCSLRAIGVALVASAALVSCGDGQDQAPDTAATSDDPETVVRRYFAAFARGDARAACALMTEVAQRGIQQLPEGERAHSCEQATTQLERDTVVVALPRVRDVRISGSAATARVTSKNPPFDSGVILRRDNGGWKIAFPLAVVSRFDSPPGIRPHDDEPHEGE